MKTIDELQAEALALKISQEAIAKQIAGAESAERERRYAEERAAKEKAREDARRAQELKDREHFVKILERLHSCGATETSLDETKNKIIGLEGAEAYIDMYNSSRSFKVYGATEPKYSPRDGRTFEGPKAESRFPLKKDGSYNYDGIARELISRSCSVVDKRKKAEAAERARHGSLVYSNELNTEFGLRKYYKPFVEPSSSDCEKVVLDIGSLGSITPSQARAILRVLDEQGLIKK